MTLAGRVRSVAVAAGLEAPAAWTQPQKAGAMKLAAVLLVLVLV